jgi:hypothetical protein
MSNQEHNEYRLEQARALDKFHDRFDHQKSPDWLSDEAKAEEKDYIYNLGSHTAELNKLGTLMLSESGTRMVLSAPEPGTLVLL